MTLANDYATRYPDPNNLMTALDRDGIESDQDWEREQTTWIFEDGSKVIVSGSDVSVEEG